jgi:prevent-host-death family protein
MRTVTADEAAAHFTDLLAAVASGETIVITERGAPVARLVPAVEDRRASVAAAVEAMKEFRQGRKLDGITVRELIDEGRRY